MYGTGGIHVQFSWWKKSGGRDRFISHASFQFALPLPPDFPRQILQPPCFPMVCACRVAATKLLERKTGSSDIRSRDALIVLKVDSFIYCPTNHGKWLLSLSIYLFLYLKLLLEAHVADFDPRSDFLHDWSRMQKSRKLQRGDARDTREFYSLSRATFLCIQRGSKTSFIKSEKGEKKRFPPSFRRFRSLVRIVRLQRACDASPLSTRPCN